MKEEIKQGKEKKDSEMKIEAKEEVNPKKRKAEEITNVAPENLFEILSEDKPIVKKMKQNEHEDNKS